MPPKLANSGEASTKKGAKIEEFKAKPIWRAKSTQAA
jgi:hypothetical protein